MFTRNDLLFERKPMGFEVVELTDKSETILYENGLEARLHNVDFRVPTGIGEGYIQLIHEREDGKVFASFSYTGRELSYLRGDNDHNQKYYPDRHLAASNLKNRKVLDLDCGNGEFVRDLVAAGIDAYGLDLYILPAIRRDPRLIQTIFEESNLAENQFDVIFSTYGNFYFHTNPEKMLKRFQLISKLLKKGGRLLISPAKREEVKKTVELIADLRMLPLDLDWDPKSIIPGHPLYYAEIIKS